MKPTWFYSFVGSDLLEKIASEADVFDCYVCEVGSGPGSLTRSILYAGASHVAAVEVDARFLPALEVSQIMFLCITCTVYTLKLY